MDLLDFSDCKLCFEEALPARASLLLDQAAREYGQETAETALLRAHLLAPENLTVRSSRPMKSSAFPLPWSEETAMNETRTLAEALEELASAEDFLDFFAVPYDTDVVQVNRLHILQRFHDYLARQAPELPQEEAAQHAIYRLWLARAYQDFVASDALTEKVFAVFHHVQKPGGGSTSFVPLDKVFHK
ncbi:Nitrogenase-stabilizing/protective protein NifW (modular protein) [Candidatus Accumulibacter aalborgensis]|uniref:Nitrogenase-stabilizing/protective protein NifW n=2 Tax=Candidatus Accumulibacter aalborgensis TaxID=1860102 RepID=A0A1A8XT10_9PROT|nr:Nitrogenase-stabilizing/protective protein NifW (modular protein) [Candidatus Accumulibacter aalborgensis]